MGTESGIRNMTAGSPFRHILMFTLPLLAGNFLQQFYNMVDSWVVGNFVSNEAFSAVGTVGPIINMLIGFFMGLSSGAGVVISQYYGAHRPEKVRDTVHTAMVLTLVLCAVFTALGLALIPAMLDLMNTPAEVLPESTAYLSIYFSGITGLLIYNMGSGILRAVGDSRRPFYFLLVSAVLNTGLDLLFVIRFHMGVAGVAWATIIAQAVSAVLVLSVLTGALVSVCGTIGFVGLIIPHVSRAIAGTAHRKLLPIAALSGGLFMLWVDAIARSLIPNTELPVGIFTALVGAPFFVYVMVRKKYGFGGN